MGPLPSAVTSGLAVPLATVASEALDVLVLLATSPVGAPALVLDQAATTAKGRPVLPATGPAAAPTGAAGAEAVATVLATTEVVADVVATVLQGLGGRPEPCPPLSPTARAAVRVALVPPAP